MKKRIVITGMGVNTPLGDDLPGYLDMLMRGISGITLMKSVDTSRVSCKIGGDLGNYNFAGKLEKLKNTVPENAFKRLKKIFKTAPLSAKLTTLTAVDAFKAAGLFDIAVDPDRISVIVGGNNMNDNYLYDNMKRFFEEPEYIDGLLGICSFDTDVAASISETLQTQGPMYTVGGTCASTGIALRSAVSEINNGDCDISVVGGGVLDFSPVSYQSLVMLGAVSYRSFNDKPQKASRPFDTKREGFVPSHGTAMFVIEELEHAKKRNADIYAEIMAVESSSDGNHLSNPSVEGQTKLMKKVLDKAGVRPEQIDYINAHATSTPLGDKVEIESIKNVFGSHSAKLKINATKSMIGHTGWACHGTELIAGILQMRNSCLHPSINIDGLDPEVTLDVCANKAVQNYNINYFLKNSFGFGGINCCSVIGKWEG